MMSDAIVVGIDGSPDSNAALQWAIDEARLRDCELVVVHAWSITALAMLGSYGYALDAKPPEEAGQALLDETMQRIAESGINTRSVLAQGSASHAIITAANEANLVVVGARGHGGFSGLVLGSVSNQVVHHALCPVVVVPLRASD